jgi:hypothetical protein
MEPVMNDTPEWIKERNEKKKRESEQAAAGAQRAVEDAATYTTKGPEIWQRFTKALTVNANTVSMIEDVRLSGSTTMTGPPGAEVSCQVNVDRLGPPMPELSYLVFHYATGSGVIRVTQPNGAEKLLRLQIGQSGGILGILYEGGILSPETMAETVIREMVEVVTR